MSDNTNNSGGHENDSLHLTSQTTPNPNVQPTPHNVAWASTMRGEAGSSSGSQTIRRAHADDAAVIGLPGLNTREQREQLEDCALAKFATRAHGAGNRERPESADEFRTCFERDRDRILHSPAFRRLAGKTQVFVFPDDHQRTRLTHALEVAQIAVSVARRLRLNTSLTEAIALGHDCGHGAGGHASEEALSPYLPGGYDHANWGADVVLKPLNLCVETLDGVRNHSWSHPSPSTPEGVVVSWADRIAYCCHDLEDAVQAGIVSYDMVPQSILALTGQHRGAQIGTFIDGMARAAELTGEVGMVAELAEALGELRHFNYENIYLRPSSRQQAEAVIVVLRGLVEFYADAPNLIPEVQRNGGIAAGTEPALQAAVTYVAGMTDRFAFGQAVSRLGWPPAKLPMGVDIER